MFIFMNAVGWVVLVLAALGAVALVIWMYRGRNALTGPVDIVHDPQEPIDPSEKLPPPDRRT